MNSVSIVGRLASDVEVRYSQNGTAISSFTIAVTRRFKPEEADFIKCKAFGKTAEFISKYFTKGSRIGTTGRIQTGSYENKDGKKVYTTDVIVEEAEFVESKKNSEGAEATPVTKPLDTFVNIPDGIDEELPFT